MNPKESMERITKIIKISEEYSPIHLNGILIPLRLYDELLMYINFLYHDAKEGKQYQKYWMDSVNASQKSVNDFVMMLLNEDLIINTEKVNHEEGDEK